MSVRARSGPPGDRPSPPAPGKPPGWRQWLIPVGLLLTLLFLFAPIFGSGAAPVDYGTLVGQLQAGHVDTLVLRSDGAITGTYRSDFDHGATFTSTYPTGLSGPDPAFLAAARDTRLVPHFQAVTVGPSILGTLLSFLPVLLFLAYFFYVGRVARNGGGMLGGAVGRMQPKVVDAERPRRGSGTWPGTSP